MAYFILKFIMHKKEPDDLGLLVGTLRVILSLAVMAT
jgi:hypothetical protein